jgi:hypothetical protein
VGDRDDGAAGSLGHLRSLAISHPQARFLDFLAGRGGEISWDWEKVERPDAREMVADLINKGLLLEREYVTHAAQLHGRNHLRLTDQGRAVAGRLETLRASATTAADAATATAADDGRPRGEG